MSRIAFPISDEMYEKLRDAIPWGVQNQIYQALTQQLLDVTKELGPQILFLIIKGEFNAITKELKEARSFDEN